MSILKPSEFTAPNPQQPENTEETKPIETVEDNDVLLPEDTQQGSKRFRLRRKDGRMCQLHIQTKKLSIIYPEPDWIKPPEDPDKGLTDRQRFYKKNVVSMSDLTKKTDKVVKSNNVQGWDKYILIAELKTAKNGFIYYTIPLIINIIFLIFNMFKYNFWANIVLGVVGLIDILVLFGIWKGKDNVVVKIIYTMIVVVFNVCLYFLGEVVPGFYKLIDLGYSIKLFLIAMCIYHFGKFYVIFLKVYADDLAVSQKHRVQINSGDPGSGKTVSMVQDVGVMAKENWRKLQYEYFLWHSREEEIFKRNDFNELLQYYRLRTSYEFYANSECIPCLHTVYGVEDASGRRSHQITVRQLKGLDILPEFCVVSLDEVGAFLRAEDGGISNNAKPLDISDTFRLGRHYYDWTVVGTEQDFNHIYIDCRRVVGFNKVMQGQEWVCKPLLLTIILDFIKLFKADSLDEKIKTKPKEAKFLSWFENFTKSIGFRKVSYTYAKNTETRSGLRFEDKNHQNGKTYYRYICSKPILKYDDRAYRQLNPSYYDKNIYSKLHDKLYLDGKDYEYSRQFQNTTDGIEEKREVTDNIIKEIIN